MSGSRGYQRGNITPGRYPEHTRILAAKLRRALVADLKRGCLHVDRVGNHHPPRFEQSQLPDFSGGMVRDNPDLNKRLADMTALGRAGLPDDRSVA
jgi:hypothetical protein